MDVVVVVFKYRSWRAVSRGLGTRRDNPPACGVDCTEWYSHNILVLHKSV